MAKKRKETKKPAKSSGGKAIVVGLLLTLLAGSAWMFLRPAKVLVPSVVGKTLAEATEIIKISGLTVVSQVQETEQAELDGKVLTQTPNSGASVPNRSVVTVVIAKGPDGTPIPSLIGKTRSEAEDELLRLGLRVAFQEAQSNDVPIGRVILQDPSSGSKVLAKGLVTLTISGGVGDIRVPDLYDFTLAEARAALETAGLTIEVKEVVKDDFRAGDPAYVLRQEPEAGQTLSAGAKVIVFLPIAAPTTVNATPAAGSGSHAPRLEGLSIAQARTLTNQEGVVLELADSAQESSVITFQDPPAGDPLAPGEGVLVRVSASAVVPSLSGLSEAEARAQIQKAGLSVGAVKKSFGQAPGEVLGQRPSPGIEALAGSSVDLVVSDPKAPLPVAGPAPTPAFTPAPWAE